MEGFIECSAYGLIIHGLEVLVIEHFEFGEVFCGYCCSGQGGDFGFDDDSGLQEFEGSWPILLDEVGVLGREADGDSDAVFG